jgi:hypothetical protein
MEPSAPSDTSLEAVSLTRKMEEHFAFLQWDRDINGRLYYALWIVFMGGFVLSINSTIRLNSPSVCMIMLVYLFRILAIIGSVLNFILQDEAIKAVRYSHQQLMEYRLHVSLAKHEPAEATKARDGAIALTTTLSRLDKRLSILERGLLICASLFLISGLVITWNIIPLVQVR